MESNDFQPGNYYKVFFEKQIPIEFKYLETDLVGKIICQKSTGEIFDFNTVDQYLLIKEIDPFG